MQPQAASGCKKTTKQAKTTRIWMGWGGDKGLKLKIHDQTDEKQP